MPRRYLFLVAMAGLGALSLAHPAVAQTASNNINTIVDTYKSHFSNVQTALQNDALSLFWLLAGIEFTWAIFKLALTGADFSEWLSTIVQQIMFIGFFFTVLTNSVAWGGYIVDSFRQAGNAAATSGGGQSSMSPLDIFNTGVDIVSVILSKLDLWKPSQSIAFALSGIFIMSGFAYITAMMILTLVVAYGIVSMGVLFMGFGGSRWTKDLAIKIVMAVMGVGAKLFVMEIIVGIGASMMQSWKDNPQVTITDAMVMFGCSVVMAALVKTIPDLVQSMVNGTAFTSGGALAGTAGAVAGASAGAAASFVGAGAAVAGAGKLASAQLASSLAAGTGPTSRLGRMAALTGNTAKNLGSSAMADVGNRLSGRAHHGNMGGRMAGNMFSQAGEMRANNARPTPPAAPSSAPPANDSTNSNTISSA
jgi:type IV secretion system protein TrbL